MKHRIVKYSPDYPKLSEAELGRFCHALANIDQHAVHVFKGEVHDPQSEMGMYGSAYFLGWEWKPWDFVSTARGEINPEPDFVEFVLDMVVRLGIIEYKPEDPLNKESFKAAMKGVCNTTMSQCGTKFAFSQNAYIAWCKAHNRKKIGSENVEQSKG